MAAILEVIIKRVAFSLSISKIYRNRKSKRENIKDIKEF